MPDVMRRLVERGLPELFVAGAAGDPDVAHAPAAFGSLPGRCADAGLPADLGAAGPQPMTERAKLGLVFENRYWHEDDHAQAGGISVLLVRAVAGQPSGGGRFLHEKGPGLTSLRAVAGSVGPVPNDGHHRAIPHAPQAGLRA